MTTYLPTGMKSNHFEKTTTGNVLSEILREVERAMAAANAGDSIGAAIYLEYIETIVDDACQQYGTAAVFGNLEVSKLSRP
jgi:hypothetical protein